ncbi:MAG TPA: glycosyltransferase [Thermoanaerobaculia bacterium]|nr:glycosyltransferase [Thermoanaerobaculia bacterium]
MMQPVSPSVLFLAWPFPPLNSPACVRTWNVAKELSRLGWNVSVVSPDPSLWRKPEDPGIVAAQLKALGVRPVYTRHRWKALAAGHLRTGGTLVHRFLNGVARRAVAGFQLDYGAGWRVPALRAIEAEQPPFDVILATGGPFTSFRIARELSERTGVPYVIDYRDPWTKNPHVHRADRKANVARERSIAQGAAAVTAISPTLANMLRTSFDLPDRVHVLTNGYDPEELGSVVPAEFDDAAIVYTGDFYPPLRVIDPVFAALRPLMNGAVPPWTFHYYGADTERVRDAARRHGVEERVRMHGRVPRRVALEAVKGAAASVVIASVGDGSLPQEKAIMTSKIFESFGLGTPSLVIAPDGSDVSEAVNRAGLAVHCRGNDIAGMTAQLRRFIHGERIPAREIDAYAWPSIARRLDAILQTARSAR